MSDDRQSEQKHLTQSDRQRSIGTRSSLISRGLELAHLLRQEKEVVQKQAFAIEEIILPARKIEFPTDRSLYMLSLRKWMGKLGFWEGEWQELGPAQGKFDIPEGVELMLHPGLVFQCTLDLSPLSTFGPNDLQRIGASHYHIDDEGMECLQNLTGLLELWVMETEVTDAGLKFLQKLDGLRSLNLSHTFITDSGVYYLQGLNNLTWLFLNGTDISDAALEYLKNLRNLEVLSLDNTSVTDNGCAYLKKVLPNCTISKIF